MFRSRITSICGSLCKVQNFANVLKPSNSATVPTIVTNNAFLISKASTTRLPSLQTVFSGNFSSFSGFQSQITRSFHSLQPGAGTGLANSLLNTPSRVTQAVPTRNIVVFGFKGKAKRKTVKAVVHRFYRLQWGAWIRPRSGRHRKLYKKCPTLRRWLRYHVFCSASQSLKLDKMVGKCYRTRKYYVDDPYENYHTRKEFPQFNRRGLDRNDRPFI